MSIAEEIGILSVVIAIEIGIYASTILASSVTNKVLDDIKRNKCYGLLLDTTPDVGHREQMSQIIRYVDVDFVNKKIEVKESFIGFINIHAKDAASINTCTWRSKRFSDPTFCRKRMSHIFQKYTLIYKCIDLCS